MRFNWIEFLTSITGVSTITAVSLLAAKKYDLAAAVFAALTIGAVGVFWERYSQRSGSPLNLKVIMKKRLLDKDEIEFIITHSPYPFLAAATYLLAKRKS